MVRRTRTGAGGGASVSEVSPLARVLRMVVVVINFVIGDDCIRGRGGGVEFR